MRQQRQVRAPRPDRGTPTLVEENMRIERVLLNPDRVAAAVRLAFCVYVVPLSIERLFNEQGVLKHERAVTGA